MPDLILVRHWITEHATRAGDDVDRRDTETWHPDIPTAPIVLARLRARCLDVRTAADEPIRWHHRDGAPWAAVLDLHRAGEHDHAGELARLLHWCDAHWTHDTGPRGAQLWSLLPALSGAGDEAARGGVSE